MKKLIYIAVIAAVMIPDLAIGQCSMCKAVVESDMEGGGTTAAGLNSGILYLMMFPYLLIGTVAFFYFRYKKSLKNADGE